MCVCALQFKGEQNHLSTYQQFRMLLSFIKTHSLYRAYTPMNFTHLRYFSLSLSLQNECKKNAKKRARKQEEATAAAGCRQHPLNRIRDVSLLELVRYRISRLYLWGIFSFVLFEEEMLTRGCWWCISSGCSLGVSIVFKIIEQILSIYIIIWTTFYYNEWE